MNENFDVFDDFVMTYDMNEKMIGYKYNHSYRTVHQAEEIARSLELDEEDMNLASNIALLHDVARFRQWTDYKTFDDFNSFDHGDEGVKILFDEGESCIRQGCHVWLPVGGIYELYQVHEFQNR